MPSLTISILGVPHTKQSARFVAGRVVSVAQANKKLKLWTEAAKAAAAEAMAARPEAAARVYECGPVRLDLRFLFGVKDKRKHWQPCTRRVDRDNLMKALCDAFEAAGLVKDDKLFTSGETAKLWAPVGGCIAIVTPHGEEQESDDASDLGVKVF